MVKPSIAAVGASPATVGGEGVRRGVEGALKLTVTAAKETECHKADHQESEDGSADRTADDCALGTLGPGLRSRGASRALWRGRGRGGGDEGCRHRRCVDDRAARMESDGLCLKGDKDAGGDGGGERLVSDCGDGDERDARSDEVLRLLTGRRHLRSGGASRAEVRGEKEGVGLVLHCCWMSFCFKERRGG